MNFQIRSEGMRIRMELRQLKCIMSYDIRKAFLSSGFLGGVLIAFMAGLFGAGGVIQFIFTGGSLGDVNRFYMAASEGVRSDIFLMVTPVACTLPFAAAFAEEIRSRFYIYSLPRTGMISYFMSKTLVTLLSGGLCVVLGGILLLPVFAIAFPPSGDKGVNVWETLISNSLPYLKLLLLSFLNGGLWAMVGGICTILMKNRYMAYAAPFILCYVMTTFQERYYPNLYLLSPREWVKGTWLPEPMGVLVLILLCALMILLYMFVMKRRVSNA